MKEKKQRNTPLSVSEAQERLREFGLQLVNEALYENVTTKTSVEVECAAQHKMTRIYGNLRHRGCPKCKAPFGERLVAALLRHYAFGVDDWHSKVVVGLDLTDPTRRLIFDIASESRKIAVENHSAYHDAHTSVKRFEKNISKEERLRLDELKEAKGEHIDGVMAGWKVGVVWFEASNVRTFSKGKGTYLAGAIAEFKKMAEKIGLTLRSDNVEIDEKSIYLELARGDLAGIAKDLELIGPWYGRTSEHRWRHTACGFEFSAAIQELENVKAENTGCPFCDRTGNPGAWRKFLDLLESHQYEYIDEILVVRTELQDMKLRCMRHPNAHVRTVTRSKLYQWLNSLKTDSKVSMSPPCEECAKIHKEDVALREGSRILAKRAELNTRLKKFGFELESSNASSVRDKKTGTVSAQKNVIRCEKCQYRWEIFVTQRLAKAEKIGNMGCPKCSPLKKGPKSSAR